MTTFKNSNSKKFISVICVFSLLLSLFALGAFGVSADETADSEDTSVKTFGAFEYYFSADGVVINKYTGKGMPDVSVPNTIEDKPVVSIANEAFWYCDEIVSVDLPNYLEFIGARAFQGCSSLSYIDVPDSVYEIADAAFDGCVALAEFKIPSKLMYVGGYAFDDTQWIKKFDGNDSVILGGKIFYKYTGDSPVVNIPDTVCSISANAFMGNQTLTYVNVPESLMFIGPYAFFDCPQLHSFCVPDDMYYMGDYSLGFDKFDEEGKSVQSKSFVLYANEGTLGAEYAEKWNIPLMDTKYNPTPDEMPEEEVCYAKDIETAQVTPKKENTFTAFILIVVGCVVVIGGVYAYFTIADKKRKTKEKEDRKIVHSKKKK